jgi:hypothetical protein
MKITQHHYVQRATRFTEAIQQNANLSVKFEIFGMSFVLKDIVPTTSNSKK